MGMVRFAVVVGAALLLPVQSFAQTDATRAAARDLGADGVEDFQAGNYAAANEKLSRAFNILRVPTLGLWSARALAKEGKLVEASERYLNVTRLDASKGDKALQKQAQADADTERDALQPRIPGLTLELKGATGAVDVTLDGIPVESALIGVRQPANPGKHVAEARAGGRLVRREITLTEGQRLSLALDFANATAAPVGAAAPTAAAPTESAPAPTTSPPPAGDSGGKKVPAGVWVGVAIAGAGLITGGVTAGLAASKKSDLSCPNNVCQASQRDGANSYNGLLTISTIGFAAAGAGVAIAGVFWFTRPSEPERAAYVAPWVGVGAAGLRGAF